MRKVFSIRLINYFWYLDVTVNELDKTIFIHNHYRIHGEDYKNQPDSIAGKFRLLETPNGRVVTAAYLEDKQADTMLIYAVENPKNIFSYENEVKDV